MGNKNSTANGQVDTAANPSNTPVIQQEKERYAYQNVDKFIPLFTTKTSILVHGYIRIKIIEAKIINQIIPLPIIDIIYFYAKNTKATFIIIFENDTNSQHSYLHEIDIESTTNKNLSIAYNHNKHNNNVDNIIWKRVVGATYCYGPYSINKNEEYNAIYRIATPKESIVCILNTRQIIQLPEIECLHSQTLYIRNRGVFVIGGCLKTYDEMYANSKKVLHLQYWDKYKTNERKYFWDKSICEMNAKRDSHLALGYESRHYDISDTIFCFGGAHTNTVEYYHFNGDNQWTMCKAKDEYYNQLNSIQIFKSGGCIDYNTNTIYFGGGEARPKYIHQFDLEKEKVGNMDYTNFKHDFYPKMAINNNVVVIFGNNGYSETRKSYGYVEYCDTRSNYKWTVLSSFREMLEFSGQDVKNRFYQQIIQM
eukprot:288790_1